MEDFDIEIRVPDFPENYFNYSRGDYDGVYESINMRQIKGGTHDKPYASNKMTKHLAQSGIYSYWMATIFDDDASLIYDSDLDHLYGLMNGAKHAGATPEQVILTWPYKDGKYFKIENLQLRYPDDI